MIRVGSIWFVVRSIGKVDVTGKGLIEFVILESDLLYSGSQKSATERPGRPQAVVLPKINDGPRSIHHRVVRKPREHNVCVCVCVCVPKRTGGMLVSREECFPSVSHYYTVHAII